MKVNHVVLVALVISSVVQLPAVALENREPCTNEPTHRGDAPICRNKENKTTFNPPKTNPKSPTTTASGSSREELPECRTIEQKNKFCKRRA